MIFISFSRFINTLDNFLHLRSFALVFVNKTTLLSSYVTTTSSRNVHTHTGTSTATRHTQRKHTSMESDSARTGSYHKSCCAGSVNSCRWYAACTVPPRGPTRLAGTCCAAFWWSGLGNTEGRCQASTRREIRLPHDIACTADTTLTWYQ